MGVFSQPVNPKNAVALLMFRGKLPVYAYEAITQSQNGTPPLTVGFSEAPPDLKPDYLFSLGQAGKLIKTLHRHKIRKICFFGSLSRPKFFNLRFDIKGVTFFWHLKTALLQGDDALMRAIIAYFESNDLIVPQPSEILPSLLCPAGAATEVKPNESDFIAAKAGLRYLALTAQTDTGQACAASGKIVSAVEAAEGTAEMIERAGRLAKTRLRAAPAPVLIKILKRGQETRADLPVIGTETVAQLQAAGFRGAFLSAGKSFLCPPAETIAGANRAGLFLYGLSEAEELAFQ